MDKAREIVESIKEKYPDPVNSKDLDAFTRPRSQRYCVGGAFLSSFEEHKFLPFPMVRRLEACLIEKFEFQGEFAHDLAMMIIRMNDSERFIVAWFMVEHAFSVADPDIVDAWYDRLCKDDKPSQEPVGC